MADNSESNSSANEPEVIITELNNPSNVTSDKLKVIFSPKENSSVSIRRVSNFKKHKVDEIQKSVTKPDLPSVPVISNNAHLDDSSNKTNENVQEPTTTTVKTTNFKQSKVAQIRNRAEKVSAKEREADDEMVVKRKSFWQHFTLKQHYDIVRLWYLSKYECEGGVIQKGPDADPKKEARYSWLQNEFNARYWENEAPSYKSIRETVRRFEIGEELVKPKGMKKKDPVEKLSQENVDKVKREIEATDGKVSIRSLSAKLQLPHATLSRVFKAGTFNDVCVKQEIYFARQTNNMTEFEKQHREEMNERRKLLNKQRAEGVPKDQRLPRKKRITFPENRTRPPQYKRPKVWQKNKRKLDDDDIVDDHASADSEAANNLVNLHLSTATSINDVTISPVASSSSTHTSQDPNSFFQQMGIQPHYNTRSCQHQTNYSYDYQSY